MGKLNLYQKLLEIQKKIIWLKKDTDWNNYKYVSLSVSQSRSDSLVSSVLSVGSEQVFALFSTLTIYPGKSHRYFR